MSSLGQLWALLWLAFLAVPDSGVTNRSDDRKPADVTGEVELRQAASGDAIDASDVVVWLVPAVPVRKISTSAPNPHYRLLQRNKRFEPGLLVVPVGSVVDFPNADPWFHNVFSLYRGKRFDLGLYQAGTQRSVKFDRIGPSYLFCNIHPEMTAVVLAVDSDFYAITDKAGRYAIPGVPPGKYTVHLWHQTATPELLNSLQRSVTIEAENHAIPMISVAITQQLRGDHKNKYGQDYDPNTLRTDY